MTFTDADQDVDLDAVASILRTFGIMCTTVAETRARVGVLDRMGAFHYGERRALIDAGILVHE